MVFAKVYLQGVVIHIILRIASAVSSIADMASLVLVPAVCIQLIVAVESLLAKAALWMAPETCLIFGPRVVITESFVFPELLRSE